ncbi:ISAs1 family transposase, partial [Akkermansiaceae bacterium]|nr:ISAs1 family transposase [Akkermansiaceae bacterium]
AVTQKLDWMIPSIRKRWKDLTTLIMLESESYSMTDQKTTKQKRFYISSRSGSAKEFSGLIRQHWSIENSCHWVLGTLYREDHSQVRIEKAVKNFAILRRMAHNRLKSETSIKKSLPRKRRQAMFNHAYRESVLSLA